MWISTDIIEALRDHALEIPASGVQSSGGMDAVWNAWQGMMKMYSEDSNAGGLSKLSFWLVISLPGDSYSEKLEWHDKIPMLVPSSGTGSLLGLARTKAELDEMMFEDSKAKDGRPGNVHLTYKVGVQGQKAWRDLLNFLAEHDMLEKE